MALMIPQKGVRRVEHNAGTVGSANFGTSVTTGAASGTKGTAVQLIASTAFDAYWVTVMSHSYGASATASEGCLDILTGAATEEVLIPNLLMGYTGTATTGYIKKWDFPLYIPAGTRLAAQAAGVRTSTAFRVAIYLYGGDGYPAFRVGSKVTTYGVTVPNGTAITPGASGAEGSWTQITASTSEDHFALYPSFQVATDTTVSNLNLAVDIGLGAATEEEIAQSYFYCTESSERMNGPWPSMPCFQDIPSGTRLVMRASNSGVNDAAYNGALHGVS
jgi:hypothetical protein